MTTATPYDRSFYERQRDGSAASAQVVVPLVVDLIGVPGSVVDVGCGAGGWLAAFAAAGVADIAGFDGGAVPPDMLLIPAERFAKADLAVPLRLDRRFDLACSLEVAEHLPAERAAGFVADLTAAAPVVLFSAAIPGQGGTGHVNERWPDYWAELFAAHGYRPVDALRPQVWQNPRVQWWYTQNLLLFADDQALAAHPRLAEAARATRPQQLSLVHPARFDLARRQVGMLMRELRAGRRTSDAQGG